MRKNKKADNNLFNGLKVAAVSLGCAKNLVDTEEVLGFLLESGAKIIADPSKADLIFVNTCGFIEEAQQEAVNTLLEMAALKKQGKQFLVAAGCLVEVYGNSLASLIPQIDGVIGTHGYRNLKHLLKLVLQGYKPYYRPKPGLSYRGLKTRMITSASHSVNVRIAEGCDNRCSYCLIPSIRGSYQSRDEKDIIAEISDLLERGTKEIVLIAQDTTAYGLKNKDSSLADLIEKILTIKKDFWLRIMYTYPSRIEERLLKLIASEKRICNYLDIPIQHVDNKILQNMGRHYTNSELSCLIEKVRNQVPGIALRTTCMVGFPGETLKEFSNLVDFIKKNPFENMGSFVYSGQKHTAAFRLHSRVAKRVAKKRRNILMAIQQERSFRHNLSLVGKKMFVLIDRVDPRRRGYYFGRTEQQAPDVDGMIYLRSEKNLKPGDWVEAGIDAAADYNLLSLRTKYLEHLPY